MLIFIRILSFYVLLFSSLNLHVINLIFSIRSIFVLTIFYFYVSSFFSTTKKKTLCNIHFTLKPVVPILCRGRSRWCVLMQICARAKADGAFFSVKFVPRSNSVKRCAKKVSCGALKTIR